MARIFIGAFSVLLFPLVPTGAQAQLQGSSVRLVTPDQEAAYFVRATLNDSGLLSLINSDGAVDQGTTPTVTDFFAVDRKAPDGGTLFANVVRITPSGSFAIIGGTTVNTTRAVFFVNATTVRRDAIQRGSAPGGGVFDTIFAPAANDSGITAFRATTIGGAGDGIFLGDANGTHALALYTDAAPDGGTFVQFSSDQFVTASGKVFFAATTTAGGGTRFYFGDLSGLTPLPELTGAATASINDLDQLLFVKDGTLYLGDRNSSHAIVSSGDATPIGGTFYAPLNQSFNNKGQVAFTSKINTDDNSYQEGIFLYTSSGIRTIARTGIAPGGGTFNIAVLQNALPVLNDQGRVAFAANTSSGPRIFVGDGASLTKIVGAGDLVDGQVVTNVNLFSHEEGSGSGLKSFNSRGQLVYDLYRIGTYVFTPDGVPTGPLPTVTLAATTPTVTVGTGGKALVTLSLPAAQSTDVTVNYTVKGTAINGTDYALLSGHKKIKAGQTSRDIKIIPQGSLGGAAKKTVKLSLTVGDNYTVGTTAPVKVKILRGN